MPTSIKYAKYAVVGHSPNHGAGILFWTTTKMEAGVLQCEVNNTPEGQACIRKVVRWPACFHPIARFIGYEPL
jgi:hypothetical protein